MAQNDNEMIMDGIVAYALAKRYTQQFLGTGIINVAIVDLEGTINLDFLMSDGSHVFTPIDGVLTPQQKADVVKVLPVLNKMLENTEGRVQYDEKTILTEEDISLDQTKQLVKLLSIITIDSDGKGKINNIKFDMDADNDITANGKKILYSEDIRDFTTDPIDLSFEVIGKLPQANMDTTGLARDTDLADYMKVADFDTNSNGIVDKAETLEGLTKTVDELNNMLDLDSFVAGDGIELEKDVDNNTLTIKSTGQSVTFDRWITSTEYKEKDYVVNDYKLYQCITAHTSSTFEDDIANWELIIGGGSGANIDDDKVSEDTTYSSQKIASEIERVSGQTSTISLPYFSDPTV